MGYQFNPLTGNLDLVGGGGGNPFDQSLNTTDSPRFSGLTIRDPNDATLGTLSANLITFNDGADGTGSFTASGMIASADNGHGSYYKLTALGVEFGESADGSITNPAITKLVHGAIEDTPNGSSSPTVLTFPPTSGTLATSDQSLEQTSDVLFNSVYFNQYAVYSPTSASGVPVSKGVTYYDSANNAFYGYVSNSSTGLRKFTTGNASDLTSGTLDIARLPSGVVTTTGAQTLTNKSISSGQITGLATIATSGSASDLGSGTLADARLSSNVTLLTSAQTLTNKTLTTPLVSNGTTNAILTAYTNNILSVSNSTTACGFSIFNTRTDASNYEAGIFDFTTNANSLTIGTTKAGTGTARRVRINSAEQIDFYCTDTSRMLQVSTSAVTAFNSFGFQWFSSASDPTTSSTPFSNGSSYCAVYKNTTSGVVSLWVRDGSTMKKVALA
jgi:hypothetical protein